MKADLTKAINVLNDGQYTCVLCKGDEIYTRTERGVKPLLDLLNSGIDLKGFSAADKVVGKAAAFLYILLGVKEAYARMMSESAIYTLARNGIYPQCDISVANIINRAGTGYCPMEEAVDQMLDPRKALQAIRAKLIWMETAQYTESRTEVRHK